jgi:hypothetical protein
MPFDIDANRHHGGGREDLAVRSRDEDWNPAVRLCPAGVPIFGS